VCSRTVKIVKAGQALRWQGNAAQRAVAMAQGGADHFDVAADKLADLFADHGLAQVGHHYADGAQAVINASKQPFQGRT
jgi:hypothetical protein